MIFVRVRYFAKNFAPNFKTYSARSSSSWRMSEGGRSGAKTSGRSVDVHQWVGDVREQHPAPRWENNQRTFVSKKKWSELEPWFYYTENNQRIRHEH